MGRTITTTFAYDLKSGALGELIDIIRNDRELIICFRKKYVNVYYKSHSLFKIEEQDKKYKFTFNLGHARYIDTFENIKEELSSVGVKATKYKHSFSAVFSISKNETNHIDLKAVVGIYKSYIDDFFRGGTRNDLFENVLRNTNSLREKRHQQVLYSKYSTASGEYLFYDMELSLPKPKECTEEDEVIKREIGTHITGAPDCLAVKIDKNKVVKIVLVEVKSTREACVGDNGINKHDKDFNEIIKCSYYRNFIVESMRETIKLFADLGLCGKIDIPENIGGNQNDFEILYFFTHDDVINWTKNSGEDSKDNMKKYKELYKTNPDMFIDCSAEMKAILGNKYD